jgi:hypothetical protein
MESLFAYRSLYGEAGDAAVRDRVTAQALYFGSLIGAKYGEPFAVKETLAIDDIVKLGSPTF